MNDSMQCKLCDQVYSRKCDLMRHVKKIHDSSCTTFNEYYIKYIHGEHPTCRICKSNLVIVRSDKISDLCRECTKIEHKKLLSNLAIDRLSNPISKLTIMQKREQTTLHKYGVTHISKLDSIKNKKKTTAMNKYGVDSCMAIPAVKTARIKVLTENSSEINTKRSKSWTPDKICIANKKRTETNMDKYGVHTPTLTDAVKHKLRKSAIDRYSDPEYKKMCVENLVTKYGVENVSQLPLVKQIIEDRAQQKYQSDHYLSSYTRRLYEESIGRWMPLDLVDEFERYHRSCIIETRKNTKQLFSKWDGKCAYTGETLITDKTQCNHQLYRTIDHKQSIYNGFMNNVSPSLIGHLDNLCICSRAYNSSKGIN